MEPGPGGRSAARGHGAGPASTPPPREQERKLEQEKLSGVVKSVHRRLRKKYREGKQRTERGEGEASSPPAPCQPLPSPKGPPLQPEGAARQPLPGPLSGQDAPFSVESSVRLQAPSSRPLFFEGPSGEFQACEGAESPPPPFPVPSLGAEIVVTTHKHPDPQHRRWRSIVTRD